MERQRQELLNLLVKAEELATDLRNEVAADTVFRDQVVQKSKRLARTLQTPIDQAWDIFFQPHHLSTLQTALEAGWLHAINEAGELGVTADQLAETSQADVSLIRRMMRFLAATGSIKEIGINTYAPAEMSKIFSTPHMGAGLRHAGHDYTAAISNMPQYFANNRYRSPPSAEYGIYTFARGSPYFKYMSERPAVAESFNTFMAAARAGKKSWMDVFPFDKLKITSNEEIMLVDVGGGIGHELAALAEKKNSLGMQGKLVLQDLPEVIAQIPENWKNQFVAQAHDFFTPQKDLSFHARAYYMRNICHDWSDNDCITILSRMRDAMKPGYSTLLINDIVLPDIGCSFWQAAFDITMMAMVSGRERTKSEWKELIQSVRGLHINTIWALEAKGESIIEVMRIA